MDKPSEIVLVVAVARNGVIGSEGQLPWRLRDDLALFKQVTMGHPIIMGRKTFESIGKPLPGRTNIILSRQDMVRPGIEPATTLDEALAIARKAPGGERVCVVGGGTVYLQALQAASTVYRTMVDAEVEGDTYFPFLDPKQWRMVDEQAFAADERNEFAFWFQKLVRVY